MPLGHNQIQYAAADAYAGFELYHDTNTKGVAKQPSPRLPVHTETYLPMRPRPKKLTSLRLRPVDYKGQVITAFGFLKTRVETAQSVEADTFIW